MKEESKNNISKWREQVEDRLNYKHTSTLLKTKTVGSIRWLGLDPDHLILKFILKNSWFYNRMLRSMVSNRSSHRRCSVKKGVLRNFTKFTGKHLCQGRFLIKLQNTSRRLLLH